MQLFLNEVTSAERVMQNMNKMNSFGDRLTGTRGQWEFCEWLKSEIKAMGIPVTTKVYRFDRWSAKEWSLTVDGENIEVSSPFHYSGLTGEEGVSGRLVKVCNNPLDFQRARGKIAVCRIKNLSAISSRVAFNKRRSIPADLEVEKSYRGPVSTSFVKTLLTFWSLKLAGVKGMVCIWEDMSDAMVDGQCLNFILGYLKVPVLWVNETEGKKVLAAAKEKKNATLRLVGETEKDARTQSFHAVIKGTGDTGECIIVNTHTDGCNFSEENGGVGMLEIMRWFKAHPPVRDLVFVFVTGHFRLPVFRVGLMTSNQATGRWLKDFQELWNGKRLKAVAGCSVEHLGCTEWKDVDGVYTKTNDIDTELVYTGNKRMDEVYYKAAKERDRIRTMTLRGHNTMHFGEGQPLSKKHIPEIALVTAPDYLCSVDRTGKAHMDKFDLGLMYEQLHTFVRCIEILDGMSRKEIGRSQPYSLGLGRLK